MTLDVVPATADRWPDAVEVMGVRGDPSRCWCQYFRLRGKQWSAATADANREGLRAQICGTGGPPPGVLGYDDGVPVGWCAAGPRDSYPRVLASPNWRDDDAGPHTWVVTCFVIRTGHRRQGLAGELLAGAVELAAASGAGAVQGCAVDVGRTGRSSAADLYRGPLSVFLANGFTERRRNSDAWVLVHRQLSAARDRPTGGG